MLSHELRTPLSAILGWTYIMRDAPNDESVIGQGLEVLQRNTKTLIELISNLLDTSELYFEKTFQSNTFLGCLHNPHASIPLFSPAPHLLLLLFWAHERPKIFHRVLPPHAAILSPRKGLTGYKRVRIQRTRNPQHV